MVTFRHSRSAILRTSIQQVLTFYFWPGWQPLQQKIGTRIGQKSYLNDKNKPKCPKKNTHTFAQERKPKWERREFPTKKEKETRATDKEISVGCNRAGAGVFNVIDKSSRGRMDKEKYVDILLTRMSIFFFFCCLFFTSHILIVCFVNVSQMKIIIARFLIESVSDFSFFNLSH